MPVFTEDQLTYRRAAQDFSERYFSLDDVLRDERNGAVRDEVIKDAHKMGFTSMYVPGEDGKFPFDAVSMMFMADRLCASPSAAINLIGPGLPLAAVLRAGSPDQQAEIRRAMEGDMPARFAFALTEPGVGSDATQIRTKARADGDDFVLTGTKAFITGAGHVKNAGERGYAVVMAQLGEVGNRQGIRAFIVRGDNLGYTVSPPYDKMGLHASDTREVVLEDCRVHRSAMLGIHAKDFAEMLEMQRVMKMTLDTSRPVVAALALGIASAAYDRALDIAQTKEIRGKPLTQFQEIRHTLAGMRVDLEAVAQLVYSTGRTLDRIFNGELKGFPEEEASMAKYLAARTAVGVTRKALEIFGGDGYITESGMAMYDSAAAVFPIWEGTENVQLQTVARKLKSFDEKRIPVLEGAMEYTKNMLASAGAYNLALRLAQDRKDIDHQSVQFSLARMRSQLEAGVQVGVFAADTSDSARQQYNLLLAAAYVRSMTDGVIAAAKDIVGDGTPFGEQGIQRARLSELAFGIKPMLFDRIAGMENNFVLMPSKAWY